MSEPNINPYAPPSSGDDPADRRAPRQSLPHDPAAIAAALERLNKHLADPARVAADAKVAGGRLRRATWIVLGIALALGALVPVILTVEDIIGYVFGGLAVVFLLVALILLAQDLRVPPRVACTDPVTALRGYLRAMRLSRAGYVLACHCPDARERVVVAPDVSPVVSGPGSFRMSDPKSVREWLRAFLVAGAGQVRWARIGAFRSVGVEGDVARVQARVDLTSWPQWANILSVVLLVTVRIIGLVVALVLLFALRKRKTVVAVRTLLRGSDGRWYVYDPDFLEGA